ncbi:MAG TPA: hypothetical protein VFI70_10985 [Nitrososphaeraceae archaeon]|nr:hypothetical protein [Nitrososphaeraceae archaeon]
MIELRERGLSPLLILEFEVGGKKYQMKHGAFRNNIPRLTKRGEVELAFKSRPAFYSVPGKKFEKMMTLGRMEMPDAIVD